MSNDFPHELARQIQHINSTLTAISGLRSSIHESSQELIESKKLTATSLAQLEHVIDGYSQVLVSLLESSSSLDEIRRASGPILADLTNGVHQAMGTLRTTIENLESDISTIPEALRQLKESQSNWQTSASSTLQILQDRLTSQPQETSISSNSGFVPRLDLILPTALIGFALGVVGLNLEPLESFIWVIATLAPLLAGLSFRDIISKSQEFFRSLSK